MTQLPSEKPELFKGRHFNHLLIIQSERTRLNNMIEQDHRMVKRRCYPTPGFKAFWNAEVTLGGIELANKIKKGRFDTSEITGPGARIPQLWEAALAA